MIPYGHQTIDSDDVNEVVEVLESDWLTQGPKVLEFEKKLAGWCGAKYAVAVSSGTAALHLAFLAAGLKKGDEVITTANTFAATANMLIAVAAKPVFCDIRLDTYNIDERKIAKLITKRTKAIVPVHFAGQPCQMDEIYKIARRRKLIIVEDACHALGAKFKNNKIGGCHFSDLAVFSFHPVKSITTGEGGAILTNNKSYYGKMLCWRSHGIHKDKQGKNVMVALGYNYRMTDIEAALGISQLNKLDRFIKARRRIAQWYNQELKNIQEIVLPQELAGNHSAWHLYVVRIKDISKRDKLAAYLRGLGIGVNFHYPAVYSHPFYQQHGFKNLKLANEEEYYHSCLTLPCYPGLSPKDIKFVSAAVRNYVKNN